MHLSLLLIYRYWTAHKKQFFLIILAVVLLVIFLTTALLLTRTQLRRDYASGLYEKGYATLYYTDVSDDIYDDMLNNELVEDIGQMATYGKIGNDTHNYTFGAYLDDYAENLEYIPITAGRFPKKSGEVALFDTVIEEIFFTTEPEDYLNKQITLQVYPNDETGQPAETAQDEITLTVVGILEDTQSRDNKEILPAWNTEEGPSTPIIYLSQEDCKNYTNRTIFTLLTLYNDYIGTDEQYDTMMDFILYYNDLGAYTGMFTGRFSASVSVTNYRASSKKFFTRIYTNSTVLVIEYLSAIAILICAISLFGVMSSAYPKRMESLRLLRRIGYSRGAIFGQVVIEWIILLLSGIVIGFIIGIGLYELVLLIQYSLFDMPALQAFHAEWSVNQVTNNPFITSIICAAITFLLGYILYFIATRHPRKNHVVRRGHPRRFGRIITTLSGNTLSTICSVISLTLVLTVSVMCYTYYTNDGKGDTDDITYPFYLDDSSEASFYSYGGINMLTENVDICLYTTGTASSGITNINNFGIDANTASKIANIDGVSRVEAYGFNYAFNIYDNTEDIPNALTNEPVELEYDIVALLPDDSRIYYNVPALIGNDDVITQLESCVQDGAIGTIDNGITLVLYNTNSIAQAAYNVGDEIHTIALDANGNYRDITFTIEAIATLPMYMAESNPNLFQLSDFGQDQFFFCTDDVALSSGLAKTNLDYTYISLSDNANEKDVLNTIADILPSDTTIKIQTLSQCKSDYTTYRINAYATIFFLFLIFLFLAIFGFAAQVSARLEKRRRNSEILHAIGCDQRRLDHIFLGNILRNTLISAILGTVATYALQAFLRYQYNRAWEIDNAIWADPDYTAEMMAERNNLVSKYLLNYQMHLVPIIIPILLVALCLIIIAGITGTIALQRDRKNSLNDQQLKERNDV